MASIEYFEFLGNAWDSLSNADKQRFAEIWTGYEQVFAAEFQKFTEHKLNVSIDLMRAFSKERWMKYTFSSDNFIQESAVYRSNQDLSLGANLSQRYLLKLSYDLEDPIEVDLRGENPTSTSISEIVDKINFVFSFQFAHSVVQNSLLELRSPSVGINSSITFYPPSDETKDASEFLLGFLYSDLPVRVPKFPYKYSLPYNDIVNIEVLRDKIRKESATIFLVSETDYQVSELSKIAFKEEPPEILWGEITWIDEETPWKNFGFLMDIYQPNSGRYLEVLRGLWFAFWNGAKPQNVQSALYLLFSLPTSVGAGTVQEVTESSISILYDDTRISSKPITYIIPSQLNSKVVPGDRVERFQPLVTGIEVYDKINRPGFIKNEIGRFGIQRFLTENATRGVDPNTDESKALILLEEHSFLPQISVESFVTPDINLGNVRIFLNAIKPLAKAYLFQVIVGEFQDELPLEEKIGQEWTEVGDYYLDTNPSTYADPATLLAHETVINPGLRLDPHVLSFGESVQIEVRSFGSLIDSFTI